MFYEYQRNPEEGDIVRYTCFGDDYLRQGTVTYAQRGGYALVQFLGRKDSVRVHRSFLEVWAPGHMTVTKN